MRKNSEFVPNCQSEADRPNRARTRIFNSIQHSIVKQGEADGNGNSSTLPKMIMNDLSELLSLIYVVWRHEEVTCFMTSILDNNSCQVFLFSIILKYEAVTHYECFRHLDQLRESGWSVSRAGNNQKAHWQRVVQLSSYDVTSMWLQAKSSNWTYCAQTFCLSNYMNPAHLNE